MCQSDGVYIGNIFCDMCNQKARYADIRYNGHVHGSVAIIRCIDRKSGERSVYRKKISFALSIVVQLHVVFSKSVFSYLFMCLSHLNSLAVRFLKISIPSERLHSECTRTSDLPCNPIMDCR